MGQVFTSFHVNYKLMYSGSEQVGGQGISYRYQKQALLLSDMIMAHQNQHARGEQGNLP